VLAEFCQQLLGTDSNTGWEAKPADIQSKLEGLITMLVELYDDDGSTSARECLGGASWCAGDVNGARNRTGTSHSQTDVPRTLDGIGMGRGDGVGTYLGVGGARCSVKETDDLGSHADASSGRGALKMIRVELKTHQNSSEPTERSLNCRAHPLRLQGSTQTTGTTTELHRSIGVRTNVQTAENDARNV